MVGPRSARIVLLRSVRYIWVDCLGITPPRCNQRISYRYYYHETRLSRFRFPATWAFIVLFGAFFLLLPVALSLPIIKAIYLFDLDFGTEPGQPVTSIATNLRIGVWGTCASSKINPPSILTNYGECTEVGLGYDVPKELLGLTEHPELANAALRVLTLLFAFHPICTVLAFIGMFTALFLASHCSTIITLLISILSAGTSTVVLAVDLALVIVARDKVNELPNGLVDINFGNGVWLLGGAAACAWTAVVLLSALACRCCSNRRHTYETICRC
ncbi:hypothetical protein K474DRAFT_678575 [Panus rudis PR-1116 ss-1]|nr:hypothetical protein K474DRAFT_678575 [Panus rudis PR-1116 ss-1]